MKKEWPEYADESSYAGLKNGQYLALFHGFVSEEARAEKDDWGDNGPVIGPLQYAHLTYLCDLKYAFSHEKDAEKYGIASEGHFKFEEGCLVFDGVQYGDVTVFQIRDGKMVKGSTFCRTCKSNSGQTVYSDYWGGDAPCPDCAPIPVEYAYGIQENDAYHVLDGGYASKVEAIKAREDSGAEGASILRIEILND